MNAALTWAVPCLLLLATACGPYETMAERTARATGDRVAAYAACDTTATPADGATPADDALPDSSATQEATPDGAPADATPCPDTALTATMEATSTATVAPSPQPLAVTPTPEPARTATPAAATEIATEAAITPDATSAAATETARAAHSVAYLSIGDGIQWGCCGALGSSSPSIFRDYLETRIGRPVIWQTSGFGYQTTDTFINGIDGTEPQLDFALKLIDYYRNSDVPVAAITISIGGNNLVDIGRACASPPCADAFAAGLDHLREQLRVIYARVAAAKEPTTPVLALLYYDSNECAHNGYSGAAVDAWDAVIAEVAAQYGAFLVDARSLFRGHCDWIDANGLDANAAGHAAIAAEYQRVYEALPPELLLPR